MGRLHANFLAGELSADLSNVATTIHSASYASLPEIVSPNFLVDTMDPLGSAGNPELVKIIAHAPGATSATVVRGWEGTSARAHLAGTKRRHGATARDFDVRVENILDYVVEGNTDQFANYMKAIESCDNTGAALNHPQGVSVYLTTPGLLLPDNFRWFGNGELRTDVTGTFCFAQNEGLGGSSANEGIDIRGLRFRREADLDGTEGPYDGALNLRKCDNTYVDDVRFDGGMTGVHFEGCSNYGWGSIYGYRQGDITLRINTYAGGTQAQSMRPGKAVSIEAGYQLLDGTALPNPSGPLGSGHLCTQHDAQLGDLVGVDCRYYGYEMGGVAENVSIRSYEGIVYTAGRSASMLLADFKGLHIGRVTMRLIAAGSGTAGVVADGDGAAQVQEDLRIDSIVGWDRSGSSTERILCTIGDDIVRASVGSIWSDGFKALSLGGSSTLAGTQDIEIGDLFCRNAPKAGAYISGGASDRGFHFGRVKVVDGRGLDADPKQNAGIVFDSAPDTTIDSLWSGDTRSGGARTQTYGIYNNGSAVVIGDMELVNNKTGDIAQDNTATVVADITGSGSPETVHTASIGSRFRRTDGGANTSTYIKESGTLSKTGWVGK